jgi:hypothetical protein
MKNTAPVPTTGVPTVSIYDDYFAIYTCGL